MGENILSIWGRLCPSCHSSPPFLPARRSQNLAPCGKKPLPPMRTRAPPTMAAPTWIDASHWEPTEGQCSEENRPPIRRGWSLGSCQRAQVRLIGRKGKTGRPLPTTGPAQLTEGQYAWKSFPKQWARVWGRGRKAGIKRAVWLGRPRCGSSVTPMARFAGCLPSHIPS